MARREQQADAEGASVASGGTDEELAALEAAPQRSRRVTLVVMAVSAVLTALLVWSLGGEAYYAVRDTAPVDVGDLARAELGSELDNRHVRGRANLDGARGVVFRRFGDSDSHDARPVVGAPHIWVTYRVPASFAGPRFVMPEVLSGRLVRLADVGIRYRGLSAALAQSPGPPVPPDAWLLQEGVDPAATRWVLAFTVLLLGFLGWNVYGIARLLRWPRRG